MKTVLLLLAALASAVIQPRYPRRVVNRVECVTAWDDRACKPYHRASDAPTFAPVYLLISDEGSACLADGAAYVAVPNGERLDCEWRRPR